MTAAATVIALGESAHFVSEFSLLRVEMVEQLVADDGISDLALEVGADEAPAIEAWLRRDRNDPLTNLVGPLTHCLYGTFLTELRDRLDRGRGRR